jgi:DNA-binding NarL/FixJ family response regulator
LKDAWVAAGRAPCEVRLDAFRPNAEAAALFKAGFGQITVHAVDGSHGVQPALWLAVAQVAESDSSWRQAGLQLCLPAIYFAVLRSQPPDSRSLEKASEAAARALLSARELEVLRAVRSALSNVEIGEKLGISALTVKNHLRRIMRKLGARSRVQAVAEAMSRQLIV